MTQFLKSAILWLFIAMLPFQSIAATLLTCASDHEANASIVSVAQAHQHDSVGHNDASDQHKPSHESSTAHNHFKCANYTVSAATVSSSVVDVPIMSAYGIAAFTSIPVAFSSHIPDYPDRPPRFILV